MRSPVTVALCCLACLWRAFLCPPEAAAQDADPFTLIFGEEEIDASADAAPGQDDVLLLELRLRRLILSRDFIAYRTPAGVCAPLADFFELMSVPIAVQDSGLEGWFGDPGNTLELDFDSLSGARAGAALSLPEGALTVSENGPCLDLSALETLLGLPVRYEARNLLIRLEPEQVLPIEARLEREAARRVLAESARLERSDYPEFEAAYRWLRAPVADIAVSAAIGAGGEAELSADFEATGDLFFATARLRGAAGTAGEGAPVRFSLQRMNPGGEIIPGLDLTRIEIGDIASPALALVRPGEVGRGLRLSDAPLFQAEIFDRTTLRGPLPAGWEAELHANGELIAFVTEPDPLGDYVFEGVALAPGYNRLEVKLFGPYGEVEIRQHTRFVGAELTPENELTYDIGVIIPEAADAPGETPAREEAATPFAYASIGYGLSETTSLAASGAIDLDGGAAAYSLTAYGSVLETYLGLSAAGDTFGGSGVRLQAQRRLGARSSLSLSHAELQPAEAAAAARRPTRLGSARFNTVVTAWGERFPLQLSSAWESRADGAGGLEAAARLSGSTRGYFWTQALSAARIAAPGGGSSVQAQGEFLLSRSVASGRLRAGLGYALRDGLRPRRFDLSYQSRVRAGAARQFRIGRDFDAGRMEAAAATSWAIGPAQVSATARLDDGGDWSGGMRLAFSLHRQRDGGALSLGPPGLSRGGALRAHLFDDIDGDGVFDTDEPALEAVELIVGETLRPKQTDAAGDILIAGLEPYREVDMEVKLSSLNDAFLRPAERGARVALRPGRIVDIPVPVIQTADLEGEVVLSREGVESPLAGVVVEAIDP